jgi:hypothetical protein
MIVSIEGLPGCRKTEIFKHFKDKFGIEVLSNFNPKLHQLYLKDPGKYALSYELDRLIKIYEQHTKAEISISEEEEVESDDTSEPAEKSTSTELTERWPHLQLFNTLHAYCEVYLHHLHHNSVMSKHDLEIVRKLHRLLYQPPDFVIYLYGNLSTCYERSQKEQHVHKFDEYKSLQYQYEWVFDVNNCRIPLFKVNVDDDFDKIMQNLCVILDKLNEKAAQKLT